MSETQTDAGRSATAIEVAAYKRGEQHRWRCPTCGEEVEVLSALMVWCSHCREEAHKLVPMFRVEVPDA